jgi:putative ABC transport system permease protein
MASQALQAMRENKVRSFLMMLGVIIGVATLTIISSSVMGARNLVMARVERFGLDQIMVMAGAGRKPGVPQPTPTTLKVEDTNAILSEISNVKDVTPQINRRDVPIKYQNRNSYAVMVATNPNWSEIWNTQAENGRFFNDTEVSRLSRVAVIGQTLASELFEGDDPVGKQIAVANNPFEVIGVLEKKGSSPTGMDLDSRIIIPLTTGMKRVFNQDYITNAKIVVEDASRMSDTVNDVKMLLRERHNLAPGVEDDFTIVTPTLIMALASKVSSTFNIFLILISLVSLVVGAVVIANIMFISVNERKAEIGIRRAVGATRRDILSQFLIESVTVSALGGIIGGLLGILTLTGLSSFTSIKSGAIIAPLTIAIISAIIVGLLAGIQPARKASRMDPIEALK